ncbi:MAG: type II secretion system F family protein [Candidatus Pacebacteria bacterium]|nr:type II secretion system F family protein [Candidatus Paceibacterota bacterium]
MLFKYEAITNTGEKKIGTVDAATKDLAIAAIQRRGLIVSSIGENREKKSWSEISFFGSSIKMKDIVMMSRQVATLFEAQVSALKAFNLLATNTENKALVKILNIVADDIQAGSTISTALSKHPEVFSPFYVNMVKSGEESGKLNQTFNYLADYLDRQYQLTSKTRNALIYPGFVIGVFVVVMIMMFTFIVPKLAEIIKESGQAVPFSTKVVMGISDVLVNYWIFILMGIVAIFIYLIKLATSPAGKRYADHLKISLPIVRNIYLKLYLSRIADNMDTMISSGISILRAIELTSAVVGSSIFEEILKDVAEQVKGGSTLSEAFSRHPEIPTIMVGMISVGEETGSLGNILRTLGHFYSREVNDAVDTLVSLIEPMMIVALGLGVGLLLASVLMPIYNIAGGIG